MSDKKTTQRKEILAYLQEYGSITAMIALERFGCFRLGARVFELRALGYDIESVMEPNADRGHHARYIYHEKSTDWGTTNATV